MKTIPATVVSCLFCDHTETGEGYAPHEAIETHQAEVHGRRKRWATDLPDLPDPQGSLFGRTAHV